MPSPAVAVPMSSSSSSSALRQICGIASRSRSSTRWPAVCPSGNSFTTASTWFSHQAQRYPAQAASTGTPLRTAASENSAACVASSSRCQASAPSMPSPASTRASERPRWRSSSRSSRVSRLAMSWRLSARARGVSSLLHARYIRTSSGRSMLPTPRWATPWIQRKAASSSRIHPVSMAYSMPCEKLKAPIGRAGLTSCISRSNASGSIWPPGKASRSVVVMAVSMFMVVVLMVMVMVMVMAVRLTVRMLVARIGAALGLEWQGLDAHPQAQAAQHVIEHMVVQETQHADPNLQRHIAVAQMVGRARQQLRVGAGHHRQQFRRCRHGNDTSIIGQQPVAAAQHRAALENEASLLAAVQHAAQPALLPQLEGQRELLRRFERTMVVLADLQHGWPSEKKVALCQRQHGGGFAGQQLAVGPHLVGLRIDVDMRLVVVVHQVALADVARVAHGDQLLAQSQRGEAACSQR